MEGNLHHLKDLGNTYFKSKLFEEKKEVMKYSKSNLAIGLKERGSVYHLDLREACRMIFIGATRSGKTWLMREIADRLHFTGSAIFFATDIKDEFKSSNEPVQPKFRHLLLPIEEPMGMNVATFRPTYFKQIDKDLPKLNGWYAISIDKLSRADFMTFMRADSLSSAQQTILEIVYSKLQDWLKENDIKDFNVDMFDEFIDELDDINQTQKNSIKQRLSPLKNSFFFESKYQRSVVKFLRQKWCVAINFEGFDNFGKGGYQYNETLLAVALREVINARRKKQIPPVWIFLDEAPRFIGVEKNNSVKIDVGESFDLDTRYRVQWALATQSLEKIPEAMVKQCRYIFIPATADVSEIRNCLLSTGLTRNQQYAQNDSIRLKKRMRRYKHSWLVLDRMEQTREIIIPLAPLSNHSETTF